MYSLTNDPLTTKFLQLKFPFLDGGPSKGPAKKRETLQQICLDKLKSLKISRVKLHVECENYQGNKMHYAQDSKLLGSHQAETFHFVSKVQCFKISENFPLYVDALFHPDFKICADATVWKSP